MRDRGVQVRRDQTQKDAADAGLHDKQENHDAVMANRCDQRAKQKSTTPATSAGSGNPGATSGDNKMVIGQKLKEILCSWLMVGDSDANNICNELCGQEKY